MNPEFLTYITYTRGFICLFLSLGLYNMSFSSILVFYFDQVYRFVSDFQWKNKFICFYLFNRCETKGRTHYPDPFEGILSAPQCNTDEYLLPPECRIYPRARSQSALSPAPHGIPTWCLSQYSNVRCWVSTTSHSRSPTVGNTSFHVPVSCGFLYFERFLLLHTCSPYSRNETPATFFTEMKWNVIMTMINL